MWLVLALLATPAAFAQTASDDAAPDRELIAQLTEEEQRQVRINRRLEQMARRIDALLTDVRSNDLLAETGGEKMQAMIRAITGINDPHVPAAAEALRQARNDLRALRPHLDEADTHIDAILAELDTLLGTARDLQRADKLLSQLREAIAEQEAAREQTRQWGRRMLADDPDAAVRRHAVRERQAEATERIEQFSKAMREATEHADGQNTRPVDVADASKDEEQRDASKRPKHDAANTESGPAADRAADKLDQAMAQLNEGDPAAAAASARDAIEAERPIEAVTRQDDALETLRAIRRTLGEDVASDRAADRRELTEELSAIRDRQQALRADTAADPDESTESAGEPGEPEAPREQRREQQARQRELQRQLAEAMNQLNLPEGPSPLDAFGRDAEDTTETQPGGDPGGEETRSASDAGSAGSGDTGDHQPGDADAPSGEQRAAAAMQDAAESMTAAERAIAADQPPRAVENQQQAERALDDAIAALAGSPSPGDTPASGGAVAMDQPGEGQPTDGAGQPGASGDAQADGESREAGKPAEASGERESADDEAKGAPGDGNATGESGDTVGSEGSQPTAGGGANGDAQGRASGTAANPGDGPRTGETGGDVAGLTGARDVSRWNVLPARQRDAVYGNYARELPVEYRRLLEAYYQTLSE